MAVVSVIIPTYNRCRKVCRAIASVLYQDFKDFEILVVEDGSSDDTLAALEQFGSRIRLILHPRRRGVSAARNSGISASRAPYVAFLDSDDYWLPGKLRRQVGFFQRNPSAVACQTGEIWIRRGRRVNPKQEHLKPDGDVFIPSLRRCLVSPSAVMLRREVFEQVGPFDEELPACEDYDLWLRIACRHPIYLIKEELVVKEGGHRDQLSSRYEALDRYRIQSLLGLMGYEGLNSTQREAVSMELSRKCLIYGTGCLKRNRDEEARLYLTLPERIRGGADPLRALEELRGPSAGLDRRSLKETQGRDGAD